MPLSCSCPDWDDADAIYFYPPDDFTILSSKKACRCSSCNELIRVGESCAKFERVRYPRSEVEARIYGDGCEIPIAPRWLCEKCAEVYFNLSDIGYCVTPEDDMDELLKEYHGLTGFVRKTW